MHCGMRHKVLHKELLRPPAVIRRIELCKTAINEKVRLAEFTKLVAIGVRAQVWCASDIDNWIAEWAL
jgi:predicted DNA-binding transcriptional regulator AlpA